MAGCMEAEEWVNAMMDNIASNSHMRMMMMQKMIHHAKSDSTATMQMCKLMVEDQEMRASLMKMMGTGTMTSGGMMEHGKMQDM